VSADRRTWPLSPAFRLALFVVLLLACCVVSLRCPVGVAFVGVVALGSAVAARVPLRTLLLRLTPLLSFAVLAGALLLIVPVSQSTPTVPFPLLGRPVPRAGVDFVLALAVKSALIVAVATAFARWVTERDLLAGLLGLRVPGRLAALLYLIVRSLHDVRDETLRLMRGRDSRGKPHGLRAIRVAAAMAQVLLIRLGQRADLRAAALVSRGFRNRLPLIESHVPER
jgi:energy-coupling factor transporter transmembrane protein EcfT